MSFPYAIPTPVLLPFSRLSEGIKKETCLFPQIIAISYKNPSLPLLGSHPRVDYDLKIYFVHVIQEA